MKLKMLLQEKLVQSSWLQDVSYYGRQNRYFPGEEIITFKVKGNPKTYIVRGLTRRDYLDWLAAKSKGKFYHAIKHKFNRDWYMKNPFRIISYAKVRPTR